MKTERIMKSLSKTLQEKERALSQKENDLDLRETRTTQKESFLKIKVTKYPLERTLCVIKKMLLVRCSKLVRLYKTVLKVLKLKF